AIAGAAPAKPNISNAINIFFIFDPPEWNFRVLNKPYTALIRMSGSVHRYFYPCDFPITPLQTC
ncbi:MAG: hypothetical protein ACLFMN_08565, partial [Desulfobacterales bacterium]